MRIAIIGAGNVGGGLGTAFARVGHEVVFGVRDPESPKTLAALDAASGSRAASPAEAVDGADVIVFTVRPDALREAVEGLPALDSRIVIDAMNRFGGDPTRSTAQDLADLLPGARVAKAFNTIGFENLTTAHDRQTPAAMFVAADDFDAKATAMRLADRDRLRGLRCRAAGQRQASRGDGPSLACAVDPARPRRSASRSRAG